MELLFQVVVGGLIIALTVIIQAVGLDFIIRHARNVENIIKRLHFPAWKSLTASIIVLYVFLVHIVQIWLWAVVYRLLECKPLHDFPEALYFSTVTFSTLGYGDIILEKSYRMLSAIESANGFLLFGWTTAFIFEVISQLYRREAKSI